MKPTRITYVVCGGVAVGAIEVICEHIVWKIPCCIEQGVNLRTDARRRAVTPPSSGVGQCVGRTVGIRRYPLVEFALWLSAILRPRPTGNRELLTLAVLYVPKRVRSMDLFGPTIVYGAILQLGKTLGTGRRGRLAKWKQPCNWTQDRLNLVAPRRE
jgi:hypothetical protein